LINLVPVVSISSAIDSNTSALSSSAAVELIIAGNIVEIEAKGL
jgi:hypothetical protein